MYNCPTNATKLAALLLLNVKINLALSEDASRTWYTVKIELKLRKWVLEKKSFQLSFERREWAGWSDSGYKELHVAHLMTDNAITVNDLSLRQVLVYSTTCMNVSDEWLTGIDRCCQILAEVLLNYRVDRIMLTDHKISIKFTFKLCYFTGIMMLDWNLRTYWPYYLIMYK